MLLSAITDEIGKNFEDSLATLKAEGFSYVDIHTVNGKPVELFTQEDITYVKNMLDKYDLKVSNVASMVFMYAKLYDDYEFTSTNEWGDSFVGSPEEHLYRLYFLFSVARQLGADSVRIFPFRWPANRTVVGTNDDREKIVCYMKKATAIAEAEKIQLVLENCPYSHLPKGLMTKDIVMKVDSEYLKMLWDPANSYRADKHRVPSEFLETTLEDELIECLPYIKYIHFKDYQYDSRLEGKKFKHVVLGQGDIEFEKLVSILKEKPYKYSVSIEPEVSSKEEILASLKYYKELFK